MVAKGYTRLGQSSAAYPGIAERSQRTSVRHIK
jgi:hypothetical protein